MEPEILIAALTPLLIAAIKKLTVILNKNVPTFLLPAIAPILGVAVDFALSALGVASAGLASAAGAGLAGIGVREIADQARKHSS